MTKWHKVVLAGFLILFFSSSTYCFEQGVLNSKTADHRVEDEIRWLQAEAIVLTASKNEQSILNAPSVVTVYTAEDIQRQGIRNVKELLERTVGFMPARNAANPLIGTRGIVAGENEPFLLLIDGHNMNSIVDKGPGDYFIFPLLSHVKRVEIVRGPGSTLWGSDAALGIIHIITKDGGDINGLQTTVDGATADGYRYANVLYGNKEDADHDVMLSFTTAKADGYPDNGFKPHPDWFAYGSMDEIKDSWEMYGKIKQRQFMFTARASDLLDSRLDSTPNWFDINSPLSTEYNRRKHYYMDLGHKKDFTKQVSLETRIFTDLMERWQGQANPVVTSGLTKIEESYYSRETRMGFESMLRARVLSRHQLLSGVSMVQTEIDPIYQKLQYPLPEDSTGTTTELVPLVIPEDRDLTMAAYVEDNWSVFQNLNLIFGLRVDHNDLREDKTKVLPRFASILGIGQYWTTKYLYNTGYVRPPVAKSFLGQKPVIPPSGWETESKQYLGVTESEEVESHDLQLIYATKSIHTSVSGYHTIFKNAFNYYGYPITIDDVEHYLFYVNSNNITTSGLELDVRHQLHKMITWYGNYSRVLRSRIDNLESSAYGSFYSFEGQFLFANDRTLLHFPHQIWNLGVDLSFAYNITANIHYRGWHWMTGQNPNPGYSTSYETLGPEHFMDMTLLFKDVYWKTLDVSVYAKNLLDNDDSKYTLPLAGYWPERGRSLGLKLSYTF
ncbi:MAG: TonB-dependent receptor [Pseudomonadota bacterium]